MATVQVHGPLQLCVAAITWNWTMQQVRHRWFCKYVPQSGREKDRVWVNLDCPVKLLELTFPDHSVPYLHENISVEGCQVLSTSWNLEGPMYNARLDAPAVEVPQQH